MPAHEAGDARGVIDGDGDGLWFCGWHRIRPRRSIHTGLYRNLATDATEERPMCRNIRTLFNFEPPATDDEIRASALQFVRMLSGITQPSRANEAAFNRAVDEVSAAAHRLLAALETASPPRDRETEAEKARARARQRFA